MGASEFDNVGFGSLTFNRSAMKKYLSNETFQAWNDCVQNRKVLSSQTASEIASGMKDWALEHGATHYSHWFQPLTGVTAEKHEGFMIPSEDDGFKLEFTSRELIKGEPDASSFPSGGLRSTFEARGYSAWDPTSYAFIKDRTLYIPTVFFAYSGEALDKKTPLLRSCDALNRQALRVLRLLGDSETRSVTANVGAEQEYFLIRKELFNRRVDLKLCGRTILGAPSPKGQELDDHYYGAIKPEVSKFMKDVNRALWKLGICSKTEHNEVAPGQFEMAPFFTTANRANDQNQLTMEIMKRVADDHNLVCILNEKPFAGTNGSGKHVNWSLSTDRGENLFSPGSSPSSNRRFLVMLAAFLKGVDEYSELLRCSTAYAGNDLRLGGLEAPPAIISVFTGMYLENLIDSIINDSNFENASGSLMEAGKAVGLSIPKDLTDRNRTSAIAYTGNKFEFRMPGASQSIASPVTYLNTIMAQQLKEIADSLEGSGNLDQDLDKLIRKILKEHRRIVFNGNGYTDSWLQEAKKRGLKNLKNTAMTLPEYMSEKNVELLTSNGIYSVSEMEGRNEVHMQKYCSLILIEARTMVKMLCDIFSSVALYSAKISPARSMVLNDAILDKIQKTSSVLMKDEEKLEALIEKASSFTDNSSLMVFCSEEIIPQLEKCRESADRLEGLTHPDYWPFPGYTELLFSF
ncbi:MAG: glutamine synthetase III [Sphaerochaetaceae bacterium]|nr:glutamine synthetase III [Sphaerochaetaceae bacterium]